MAQNKDFNYKMQFAGIDKLSNPLGKMQIAIGTTSKELRGLRKVEKQFGQFKQLKQNSVANANALKKASKEASILGREFKQTQNPTKKMSAEFKRAQMRVQSLKAAQGKEIQQLGRLGQSLKKAGYNTLNLSESQKRLKTNIGKTSASLDKQRQKLKKVGAEMRRQKAAQAKYQQSLQSAANLGIVGASGVAVGTRSVKGVFNIVETVRPLEKAIGELQSLGIDNMQAYKDMAYKTDEQLAYTTADSFIRAAYDIRSGMSGLTDEGAAEITNMALITARATKSTAEEMTSLTASAYGIFKNQYAEMSDIEWGEQFTAGLAASVKAYKTNGSAMQQAIESAKGGAALLGMGMAEEMAILGTLQASMKGAEAGTALKSYATNAAKANAAFEKAGIKINVLDSEGMLNDTQTVMKQIRAHYGSLDATEMAELKKAFGTDEAMNMINALMANQKTYVSGFNAVKNGMVAGKKTIDDMAAAIDDNADAKLQNAMEEFSAMKRDIGYALLPIFLDLIPVMKKATAWVSEFTKNHRPLIKIVGTGVMIFGALAATMGALTLTMASILGPMAVLKYAKTSLGIKSLGLMKILKPLGHAFIWVGRMAIPPLIAGIRAMGIALMTTPIGWIIAGIAAVALAGYMIVKHWKPVKKFLGKMWSGIKILFAWSPIGLLTKGIGAGLKWLSGLFHLPKITARKTWVFLKTLFAWSPLGLLMGGMGAGVNGLKAILKSPRAVVSGTWKLFKTLFAWSPIGLVKKTWDILPNVFKSVFGLITNITSLAMQRVKALISAPLKMIKGLKNKLKGIPSAVKLKIHKTKSKDERPPPPYINRKPPPKSPPILTNPLKAAAGLSAMGMMIASPALATPDFSKMTRGEPITARQSIQRVGAQIIKQAIEIHIHPAPGMDEKDLAKLVADKFAEIQRAQTRQASNSLNDIED